MRPVLSCLWLCKARYMNHDVIRDRYARLFELPQGLGRRFDLTAICLDYRFSGKPETPVDLRDSWTRISIPRTLFLGWILQVFRRARNARARYVVASSDCLNVVIGYWVARRLGARFYADLYDDYSAFGLARIPGLRTLYRRALAGADGIVAVSRTLGEDLRTRYPGVPVLVVESTIDASVFYRRERRESRELLGLDRLGGAKLVGLCGGLNRFHGADVVFAALDEIVKKRPDVVLVVAGKSFSECPLPRSDNLHYLGMLPHERMPYFYSAMDVVIVPLSNSRFGYYAFPQKAYEVLACKAPVAAAAVGALAMLFDGLPGALYDPDSPGDLARVILSQLETAALLEVEIPTWAEQSSRLAEFIQPQSTAVPAGD